MLRWRRKKTPVPALATVLLREIKIIYGTISKIKFYLRVSIFERARESAMRCRFFSFRTRVRVRACVRAAVCSHSLIKMLWALWNNEYKRAYFCYAEINCIWLVLAVSLMRYQHHHPYSTLAHTRSHACCTHNLHSHHIRAFAVSLAVVLVLVHLVSFIYCLICLCIASATTCTHTHTDIKVARRRYHC